MNIDNLELDAQSADISTLPESLSDSYREKMGKLIDLTDEQKSRISEFMKKSISDWKSDTAELHQRLQDDNDLVEGVIMETDFPWVGASNVHAPLTEIYMDGSRAIEMRSILGAGLLWVAETDDQAMLGITAEIEEMLNYKARNDWNIERMIPGAIWTTNRDGLGILQVPYVEEYEKSHDIIIITSFDEFLAEFPTPQDAGISEEEFFKLAQKAQSATEEEPLEIPITFEKQTYAGPKAELVELVDFVTFPAWAPSIKDARCRGYGKRYRAHIETIREKGKDGIFYEDEANQIIEKGKSPSATNYVQPKDDIVGLKRTNEKDERELFEMVVKGRLNDGDDIQKYLVTCSEEGDILQVMEYIYRVDFYALFVVDERPNQIIGKSIPAKTRDLNDLADTLVNQTVNANTISTVPMFKGKKDVKEELDPELDSNRIRPGMILWLSDFDSVAQFIVQPTDHGENLQVEERAMRVLDMYVGMPASLFAGGVPAGDPQAPGNKTEALITQGNLRMENPIAFLRYGIAELGDICLSHLYQFGPPQIQYLSEQKDQNGLTKKEIRTIHKKYLRKNIRMKMNGVSVIDNPEAEMLKQFKVHQMLMSTPEYAQNPELQNEVMRDALLKGRVQGRDRYLPTSEQIQAKQVEIQKQAMTQMMMEKQLQEQKAQEDQVKANLMKAKQDLDIQNTAQKLAETKLGLNGDGQ